jgi:hypothetical protein
MLNTSVDEVLTNSSGAVTGIKATMSERGSDENTMKFETKQK